MGHSRFGPFVSARDQSTIFDAPRGDFSYRNQMTGFTMWADGCLRMPHFRLTAVQLELAGFIACFFGCQAGTDSGQLGFPAAVGEKAEVADAHEALGQGERQATLIVVCSSRRFGLIITAAI